MITQGGRDDELLQSGIELRRTDIAAQLHFGQPPHGLQQTRRLHDAATEDQAIRHVQQHKICSEVRDVIGDQFDLVGRTAQLRQALPPTRDDRRSGCQPLQAVAMIGTRTLERISRMVTRRPDMTAFVMRKAHQGLAHPHHARANAGPHCSVRQGGATRPIALAPAGGGSKGTKGGKGTGAASGENRFAEEMARLAQEELRARSDLSTNAAERADLAKQMLESERAQRIAQIENETAYTREQKDAQIAAINRLYGKPAQVGKNGEIIAEGRPGLLPQQVNRDLEFRQNAIALSALEAQQATLETQVDLETNVGKRNDLERRALDLQQKIERARLDEAIATEGIAESARAELIAQQKLEKLKLARSQRSPGQVYADDLKESADNINEAIESIEVRGLNALNDGITEAIMGTKSLGDVFKGVANQIIADLIRIAVQQAIVRPIAEALFGGGSSKSSGGGILGLNNIIKTIAAIPGFATGTNNAPRGLAVVGERGPELVRFNGGEQVIPNHAIGNMGVAGTGASVVQHFHLDARGAVLTQDLVNQINSMGQRAAEAGARGGHALATRDIAQMRRPKL